MSNVEAKAGIERRHITVGLMPRNKLFIIFHKTGNESIKLCDDCFKKVQYILQKTLAIDTVEEVRKE